MATDVVPVESPEEYQAKLMERVLIHGDLAKLDATQKVEYYTAMCAKFHLNPMTRPFLYLILNNKMVLYTTKTAAEQLRKNFNISVRFVERNIVTNEKNEPYLFEVVAEAKDYSGRIDQATGSVAIQGDQGRLFKPEDYANARMKAETKAKRRVTISICGLGLLDETELDTVASTRVTWDQAMGYNEGETAKPEDVDILDAEADKKGITHEELMSLAQVDDLYKVTKQQLDMLNMTVKLRHLQPQGETTNG